jgi:hypothetical protein
MGAHTLQFRVLTYRDGQLNTLRAPRALRRTGQSRETSTWTVDSSYSFQVGVDRSVSRGRVFLTVKSSERNASGRGHTGWTVRYQRTGGDWKAVSIKKVRYPTDRAASAVGGWRVRGIPRFG